MRKTLQLLLALFLAFVPVLVQVLPANAVGNTVEVGELKPVLVLGDSHSFADSVWQPTYDANNAFQYYWAENENLAGYVGSVGVVPQKASICSVYVWAYCITTEEALEIAIRYRGRETGETRVLLREWVAVGAGAWFAIEIPLYGGTLEPLKGTPTMLQFWTGSPHGIALGPGGIYCDGENTVSLPLILNAY